MVRLVFSNLVLAYVAFLLGCYWPRETPELRILRSPPPTCNQELERLREINEALAARVNKLQSQLAQKEDIPLIVRETVRILLEGQTKP